MSIQKIIKKKTINIGVPIYDGVDSLDMAGAFQAFYLLRGAVPTYPFTVSESRRPITTLENLKIKAEYTFDDCPHIHVLFVPGAAGYGKGFPGTKKQVGVHSVLKDCLKGKNVFLDFLQQRGSKADYVTGVCTGAILLAAAGLLDGFNVTTHWAFKNVLAMFPKVHVADGYPRYVIDTNVITGGGISSAIDCGLAIGTILSGEQAAKNVQLIMQYAPDPPYNNGNPLEADILTMSQVTTQMAPLVNKTAEVVASFLEAK